ncbi:MAG: zinc ribbon domain-containing protein [Anaerolineales bacterium]|nr:zinc ribbon domain-containing protein [Anaerolineales bacterium]
MPIYEYVCMDCDTRFDALRAMREADAPIQCAECDGVHTSRVISLFAAHSDSKVVAGSTSACTSCSTHACSTCGV